MVKLANRDVDFQRRRCYDKASEGDKRIFMGSKRLLLKNPENLDEKRNEKRRLEKMLELNTPLTQLYILKEDLRQIWSLDSEEEARAALDVWIVTSMQSGDPVIMRLGRSIENHKEGILAYYRFPITSAVIEGVNNKIKTIIKKAYGYRNMMTLKLLILSARQFDPRRL